MEKEQRNILENILEEFEKGRLVEKEEQENSRRTKRFL